MRKMKLISMVAAVAILSGCVTTEGYKQEYKQASGIDLNQRSYAVDCSDLFGSVPPDMIHLLKDNYKKCAERNSGKSLVNDQFLRYSEFGGGYETSCFFGGYDRTLILDRLSKGVGLVQPVLRYGSSGEIDFDRASTERLIKQLTSVMKLKVKPISESEAYYKALMKRSDETRAEPARFDPLAALFNQSKKVETPEAPAGGNEHYRHVVSKLPKVDYIIEPSQDIVDEIISGRAVALQQQLKALAPKNDPSAVEKTTFRPSEIEDMVNLSQQIEYIIYRNSADIRLGFELVERMMAFNEKEQSFMQKSIANSVERGCAIKDVTKDFAQGQIDGAKAKSETNKSFGQQLTEMFKIDTSNGFELGLSNENLLRDQFKSQRTRLIELKKSYFDSMVERHNKINDTLVPFTGKAFQQFKITGHTQSNKL